MIERSASPLGPPPSLPDAGAEPPPDTVAVLEIVAGAGSCDRPINEDRRVGMLPAASTSLREHVSVRPAIAQLQPSPPAFAIELNRLGRERVGDRDRRAVGAEVAHIRNRERERRRLAGDQVTRCGSSRATGRCGDGVRHLVRGVVERRSERESGERRGRLVDDLLTGGVARVDRDVERRGVGVPRR